MEWVVVALVVVVVLAAVVTTLIVRERRNRSLGDHHSQAHGDASHAEAMGRAYAAGASRGTGIGSGSP